MIHFPPEKIIEAVKAHFRMGMGEILSKQKRKRFVLPRITLAWTLHEWGRLTYFEISDVMNVGFAHVCHQAHRFIVHPDREFIVHRLLMRLDPAYKKSCKIGWASWETVARKEAA